MEATTVPPLPTQQPTKRNVSLPAASATFVNVGAHAISSSTSAPPPSTHQKPQLVRGVGLTPRLFETLAYSSKACLSSCAASYVPAISQYVESVAPSKNVMAQNFVPVVMEDEVGGRHAFHVDPIAIRQFRRRMGGELQQVQGKRERMLRRIRKIRNEFPAVHAYEQANRLQREIAEAESRINEPLVVPLPPKTPTLHVFVDVSRHMVQLDLVRSRLLEELPMVLESAGTRRVSFAALGAETCGAPQYTGPRNCSGAQDILHAANEWLQDIVAEKIAVSCLAVRDSNEHSMNEGTTAAAKKLNACATAADNGTYVGSSQFSKPPAPRSNKDSNSCHIKLAGLLRKATSADALCDGDASVVLLIASSCPMAEELEACTALMRRSSTILQVVGVFGSSPQDPEPSLKQLSEAGAPGSSLRLFFGPIYWTNFARSRSLQMERVERELRKQRGDRESTDRPGGDDDNEIVSSKVFEMRLIERVMRECYVEEQRCEEELVCATKLLERKALDREEVVAAFRHQCSGAPHQPQYQHHVAMASSITNIPRVADRVSAASTLVLAGR
eukprot:TRINITY_DN56159_c0_g1_i1.p1 TRINITY_DN56159_c0_g1~~TRINITY_DN56159_c0_g1_i1.p1  ORF type:complete len:559 (-),score=83.79 TRINITY_DN56159_c0_g1_i1:211-1887(-)